MHALRLIWTYLRLGTLNELQYRANFLIRVLQAALALGTGLATLAVVFGQTDQLNGWSQSELVALLGTFFLVRGLLSVVIRPSMQHLMEGVRLGTLDYSLTKPADAQLMVSVQRVDIWSLVDVGLGIGVISVALVQLGENVGPGQALIFGLTLIAGCAIVYSFVLILSTCSFWFVRLENILVIFTSLYEAGRWPVGIYPPWLRATLTFVVPIAFAITIPAQSLTGRLAWPSLLGTLALAAAFLLGSRWFWRVGLRHYTGASA